MAYLFADQVFLGLLGERLFGLGHQVESLLLRHNFSLLQKVIRSIKWQRLPIPLALVLFILLVFQWMPRRRFVRKLGDRFRLADVDLGLMLGLDLFVRSGTWPLRPSHEGIDLGLLNLLLVFSDLILKRCSLLAPLCGIHGVLVGSLQLLELSNGYVLLARCLPAVSIIAQLVHGNNLALLLLHQSLLELLILFLPHHLLNLVFLFLQ